VVGSALVRLEDGAVADVVTLPRLAGRVSKVEGLMVLDAGDRSAGLLAVVDGDDAHAASAALRLGVSW
jgi:hypothetical protein